MPRVRRAQMKSSQPGLRPADRAAERAAGLTTALLQLLIRPNAQVHRPLIFTENGVTGGENPQRGSLLISPRDVHYLIIDGSHAVGQTGLPEVKATESSGDLRCFFLCLRQPP